MPWIITYEGETEILHILKAAPKFGNDDDYVDNIVNEVITHASQEVAKYRCFAGAKPTTCAGYATMNVALGYVVGALPDEERKSR